MREMVSMVGGCCVCSDEQGWNENPLVYCDGQGCTVAVHQACYGIVTVPSGPWYCRKCESQERAARVRCELCPNKDGALKRTDNGGWAHVVCALYIPEVRFGNVATMEPIILALVPQERFNKVCYLCLETPGKESRASHGACMQCNKAGCKDAFHVTCAQAAGLLCEEAGNYMDNVKYCGYCEHHFQKINRKLVKTIPAFRPAPADESSPAASPDKSSSSSSSSIMIKDPSSRPTNSVSSSLQCNSKGKGKKGKKTGSMIYEPRLEPPKFNPDLTSFNSSNNSNSINNSSNSVTLTPVTASTFNNHGKSSGSFAANCDARHSDKFSKTPNIVVKIGKHGEVHHAKKDAVPENNGDEPSEAILEKVTDISRVKEEIIEKKGFASNSFNDTFVPSSSSSLPTEKTESSVKVKLENHDPVESSSETFRSRFGMSGNGPMSKEPPSAASRPNDSSMSEVTSENIYSKTSLHSSVSLFPANSSNAPSKSDSNSVNSSVSILPSSSSSLVSSNMSTSALTVTQVSSAAQNKESVTISSINDDRLKLESLNQSKNGAINPPQPNNKLEKVANGLNKKVGRPPKKGTATTQSSWGNVVDVESEEEENTRKPAKRRKTETEPRESEDTGQREENNVHKFMMFGATLNPSSGMAKEMSITLQNEVAAHSVYTGEKSSSLFGVPLPGRPRVQERSVQAHAVAGMLDPARQPQTLEELLERHWEQGSRFLMDQASHFDIASLLSSLHQLKDENVGLEDSIDKLMARRDHLLAVRARLLALNSLTMNSAASSSDARKEAPAQNGSTAERRLISPGHSNLVSPMNRERTLPSPLERGAQLLPSPRDRRELQSPRDRDVSPRLHPLPAHHPLENGQEQSGSVTAAGYHRHERLTSAQLLSVAQHQTNNHHHPGQQRGQSPVSVSQAPHGKGHYPPPQHLPNHPSSRHVELRGNYPPSNFQMVSPPPPPKGHPSLSAGPPPPHLPSHYSRMAPGSGMRSSPALPPHGLPPDIHQQLMRASPQSSIHLKK